METEKRLAEYVSETKFDDLPKEPVDTIKNVLLTILGTTIAGATAEGCETLIHQVKEWGGRKEATILIHGGKVPAYNAAFVNSVMARALDFCEAMVPGMHVGSSSVPTALATAELAGGCSGKEFLTAIVLGTEMAARLNLPESAYEGFVSQGGIICAQLAQRGITGPKNFLEGIYAYFHLYAKDKYDPWAVLDGLGKKFELAKTVFKKYPSCGGTLASTDAILELSKEKGLVPEDVTRINIQVTPYIHKLVGHPFKVGENPKVNAQFSIQYCVANALLRKGSKLRHFDETFIREPKIIELVNKIHVVADPALDERGHTAVDMRVTTRNGTVLHKNVAIARGFPGKPLTKEEHNEHFQDCVSYAGKPLPPENVEKVVSLVSQLEDLTDVCNLIPLLLSQSQKAEKN